MASEQSEFWSRIAQEYDRVVDVQIGPRTRSMVRERLAQEGPLGHLVELGCGTGFYTEVLAGKADSVLATDVSRLFRICRGNPQMLWYTGMGAIESEHSSPLPGWMPR